MSRAQDQQQARMRAQLIVQVQSGLLSASQAAVKLGVSRKTYYKWEKRALAGMVQALTQKEVGRPSSPIDLEKQKLKLQNQELQQRLTSIEQSQKIRQLLEGTDWEKK